MIDMNPYLDPWDHPGLAVPRNMPLAGALVGGVPSRLRPQPVDEPVDRMFHVEHS